MALSLLIHLLVFLALTYFIQNSPITPHVREAQQLEVRLSQLVPSKHQLKTEKKIITNRVPEQLKILTPAIKISSDITSPYAPQIDRQSTPTTGAIEGIAFPATVATPFQGQSNVTKSIFNVRQGQEELVRNYAQLAMETRARQQSEQQAQTIIVQLHLMLSKLLAVDAQMKGKCILAESDNGQNNGLKCDPATLDEILSKNQKIIAALLFELKKTGSALNGFSAKTDKNTPELILINATPASNSN